MTALTTLRNIAKPAGRYALQLSLAGLLLASPLRAAEVLVAVASNFSAPMTELAERFTSDTGHRVTLTQGASGRFVAQIRNGAPFQVFLSADQEKPAALAAMGLTVPGSQFTYALGSLVLWSSDPELAIIDETMLQSGEALRSRLQSMLQLSSVRRIALANPRLAPYGRAAIETLTSLSLLEATRSRWVQGENIAQTFQFVESGNAQLGFVARSQLVARSDMALAWSVPSELHSPIRQDAVLLQAGADCQACRELLAYLRSPSAAAIIRRYGYELAKDGN